ncbi:hypothetical protein FRB96_002348 [Tulasnella sp. 330]|nr:hypothetical protein FRB96_002348 [Tulasnella sp. 330]KAG8879199.1 hypothetical protein FRB97_001866 [Tulasnella sp. 331]
MLISTSKWVVVVTCALGVLAAPSPATKFELGSDGGECGDGDGTSDVAGEATTTRTTVQAKTDGITTVNLTSSTVLTTVSVTSVSATATESSSSTLTTDSTVIPSSTTITTNVAAPVQVPRLQEQRVGPFWLLLEE